MPSYAHLSTDLLCPHCNLQVTDQAWFQWGFCKGYAPDPAFIYNIGDAVTWKKCKDGSIRSWAYFGEGRQGNLGDPDINDLITRDTSPFFQGEVACPNCSHHLQGAAIEIRGGRIQRAWIYIENEFDNASDYYLIGEDDSLKPMPEWNDHSMEIITNC